MSPHPRAPQQELRARLEALLADCREHGEPPRATLRASLSDILVFRERHGLSGLWGASPPLLLTATLDDGFGHGIETAALCARACGMETRSAGLLAAPEAIAAAARETGAALCAVTVLRTDSEEALARLASLLPPACPLVAGGPAIRHDPALAARAGVRHPAATVTDLLALLLSLAAPAAPRTP